MYYYFECWSIYMYIRWYRYMVLCYTYTVCIYVCIYIYINIYIRIIMHKRKKHPFQDHKINTFLT